VRFTPSEKAEVQGQTRETTLGIKLTGSKKQNDNSLPCMQKFLAHRQSGAPNNNIFPVTFHNNKEPLCVCLDGGVDASRKIHTTCIIYKASYIHLYLNISSASGNVFPQFQFLSRARNF